MILGAIGAALTASSLIGIHRNMPNTRLKIILRKYLEANKMNAVRIGGITREGQSYKVEFVLPYNLTADELQQHLPALEQVTSTFARFSYGGGPACYVHFGFADFKAQMPFQRFKSLAPLQIPLFTPFGACSLDFNDETNCHVLIGGATRMGKTGLIRLLATCLIHGTKGNVVLKMLDNKISDLYMFRHIPQVEIGETEGEAMAILMEALQEVQRRKDILRQHGDCVDLKEYRRKYPDNDPVHPYFVIIDEYGRYADNKEIQTCVEMLVETAGYLDMHVIIASQRPDAQTVLKARIKANLTTRICFTTVDEMNSKVVLDVPDAAKLNKIQGRAIFMDGFPRVVQVPYLPTTIATDILKPYEKRVPNDFVKPARQENSFTPEPLPSFEPSAIGEDDLPKPKKRNSNRKPSAKKA